MTLLPILKLNMVIVRLAGFAWHTLALAHMLLEPQLPLDL